MQKRGYVEAYTFTSAASVLLVSRSTSLNSKPYWRSLAAHTVAFSVMGAAEPGTVVRVLRPGYGTGQRQLRPGAVTVAAHRG